MTMMSGADALLQQLLRNRVQTIFGLPGGQLDHFFDSMYRSADRVRFVGSRHEQGAAYMAFGYARSSGRPGVYTVVPGPGVLNTTAALCSAYATNAPVMCLTGQIPSAAIAIVAITIIQRCFIEKLISFSSILPPKAQTHRVRRCVCG